MIKEETNKQTATSSTSETKAIQAFDFTAMDKDGKLWNLAISKVKKFTSICGQAGVDLVWGKSQSCGKNLPKIKKQ